MGLFKPDLYRSLAIGFLIGTLIVGVGMAPDLLSTSQQAQASVVPVADSPASAPAPATLPVA